MTKNILKKIKNQLIRRKILTLIGANILLISVLSIAQSFLTPTSKDFRITAQKLVAECKQNQDWRTCYGKSLGVVNKSLSFTQSLQVLANLQQIEPITRDCHLLAHYLSISEVEKSPSNWLEIFDYVDQTTCTNGYVHGVMEGRSRFDPELVLDEKTIPDICAQIEQKTSSRVGKTRESADDACAHIIGHILLAEENGELRNAVNTCSKVPSTIRSSCYDGIFMENITRENLEVHEVARKFALTKSASINLEKMCHDYTGDEGKSCWRELAHIYTQITSNDPAEIHTLCYQNNNEEYAKECYMHSINLMILADEFSLAQIAKVCKPYFESEQEGNYCLTRAISPLLGSSIQFANRAITICETSPENFRPFCYSKIGQYIKPKTSLERRKQLCLTAPDRYFNLCTAQQ